MGATLFLICYNSRKKLRIKRFSQEQRKALGEQGFVIYALTGHSIKTLRDSGCKFWSIFQQPSQFADFEALGSMHSEVAINPNKPYLPESNNKTSAQQGEMVEKFSEELGKEVPGVKAIIRQAPDYAELAFVYDESIGGYLFGTENNYSYAVTKTPTEDSSVVIVNLVVDEDYGLLIDSDDVDRGRGGKYAAPLIVPV